MKRYFIPCVLVCLLLTACAASTPTPQQEVYLNISPEEAKVLMDTQEDYVILDVRTQEEFDAGHIPGAILIPNTEIANRAEQELPDKDQLLLVYCRSGNRSKQAAGKLLRLGYTRVYEMGGFADWEGEITVGSETP